MLDTVSAVQVGTERIEGTREVGLGEATLTPCSEVLDDGGEVLAVVWKVRRQRLDRRDDPLDVRGRGGAVCATVKCAVGDAWSCASALVSSRSSVQAGSAAGPSGGHPPTEPADERASERC